MRTRSRRRSSVICTAGDVTYDPHAARELELYEENEQNLHRAKEAILANVYRKMKRGVYDPTLGVKLWMYHVERAAKQYAKEFERASNWSRMFTVPTRRHVAERIEAHERGLLQRGEYRQFPRLTATDRDRPSRARRGPVDRGMWLAKQVAKWQPAGGRMSPEAKLEWRRQSLRRALEREGLPWRKSFDEILTDALIKADHRSDSARFRRAYG